MKRVIWLVVAAISVIATGHADDVKSVQVRARERIESERPHKWAVIIGVNNYEDDHIRDLTCAVADARAMQSALADPGSGGFSLGKIVLLADGEAREPTRANILETLATVRDTAGPEDTVLVYFSGHGKEAGGEGYLLPSDVRLNSLKYTGVPLEAVLEIREESDCRVQIVIVDACRDQLEEGDKGSGGASAEMDSALFRDVDGVAVLSSARAGQKSYEDPASGHSVYTRFLLAALAGPADSEVSGNGDGLVSVYEAAQWARDRVRSWGVQHNLSQDPRLRLEAGGDIPLTLAVPQDATIEIPEDTSLASAIKALNAASLCTRTALASDDPKATMARYTLASEWCDIVMALHLEPSATLTYESPGGTIPFEHPAYDVLLLAGEYGLVPWDPARGFEGDMPATRADFVHGLRVVYHLGRQQHPSRSSFMPPLSSEDILRVEPALFLSTYGFTMPHFLVDPEGAVTMSEYIPAMLRLAGQWGLVE